MDCFVASILAVTGGRSAAAKRDCRDPYGARNDGKAKDQNHKQTLSVIIKYKEKFYLLTIRLVLTYHLSIFSKRIED